MFIDIETAKVFARNYCIGTDIRFKDTSTDNLNFEIAEIRKSGEMVMYYILNIVGKKGFIIVTANKNLPPVLGYFPNGSYSNDSGVRPPAFDAWLNNYTKQIEYALSNKTQHIKWQEAWDDFDSKSKYTDIDTLKLKLYTTWSQDSFYNFYCPSTVSPHPTSGEGYGGHTPVGCVAVAMGMVVKYFEWPVRGIGEHTDQDQDNFSDQGIIVDQSYGGLPFFNHTGIYDWDNMPKNLTEINLEVSKLLYNCGVSVDMNYAFNASGAWPHFIPEALRSHFDYTADAEYIEREDYTDQDWESTLINEIQNERPIIFSGWNQNGENGHTFICMGYRRLSTGTQFNFLWGWGNSTFNGYFLISDIDDIAGLDFTHFNNAIIRIIPNDQPNLGVTSISVSNTSLEKDVPFSINFGQRNTGDIAADTSTVRYYISTDQILDKDDTQLGFTHIETNPVSGTLTKSQILTISNQPNGSYYIIIKLDAAHNVHESDETNNESSININLTSPVPTLTNGYVNPISGTTDNTFTFSVVYTDKKGISPSEVRLFVDGTKYVMQKKNSGDTNFSAGVEYIYSLANPGTGTHYYSFGATDNSGNALTPFPASGNLNFYVKQSAAGWDAGIDPTNTNYSPALIKGGTIVTVTTGIRNYGTYTYTTIPYRVEMRNSSGTLLASKTGSVSNLAAGIGTTSSLQLTVPTAATNGTYSLTSCLEPTLDSNPANDCYTNYFYIGENLGNEQFRNSRGQVTKAVNDTMKIKTKVFTLMGINTSTSYATMKDPGGTSGKVYVNQIKIYGSYDALIRNDAVYSSSGVGYAALTGYYAYASGAIYDNVEINANPGTTVYAYATAPVGHTFSSSNYELYSTSTNDIKSWLGSVSKVSTWGRIKIKINVPSNAPIGKTTLYLLTEYSTPSNASDLTRLTFYITNPVPQITAISKTVISSDDQVTITGTNLGIPGTVKFNDLISPSVQSWNATSITCTVPQDVSSGIVTVVNSNGTSNALTYTILSSSGTPIVLATIPDQQLSPEQILTICDLDNIIYDPNGTSMTFTVTTNNSKIAVDESLLSSSNILKLTGAIDLLFGSKIDITGTDASGKFASTSFNITVPAIIKTNPSFATVPAVGGVGIISITSNVAWTSSKDASWITVTNSSGAISYTCQKNSSYNQRSAAINISGSGLNVNVLITQEAALAPPNLISPSNSASDIPLNTVLIWGNSISAQTYRIQVADNDLFSPALYDQSSLTSNSFPINDLMSMTKYYWRLCASKTGEISVWSEIFNFTTGNLSAIKTEFIPLKFTLIQNRPNPFTGSTRIRFILPTECNVDISLYNLTGHKIGTLVHSSFRPGDYELEWIPDPKIMNGVYFCNLIVDGKLKSSIRMVYLK